MCGRYTLARKNKVIEIIPNVTVKVNIGREISRYNISPSQQVLAITNMKSPTLEHLRWGLIPFWAKDTKVGYSMINARAETIAEKPTFKKPLSARRCLILADGFYEWKKEGTGQAMKKTPMYARMKDGDVFAFAGLWEIWKSPEGEEIRSCTIITTTPNKLMSGIHDRMPVILHREAYLDWLNPEPQPPEEMTAWLKPYPAKEMEAYAVSSAVNSPRNQGAELVEPV